MKMHYELLEAAFRPGVINDPMVYVPNDYEFIYNPEIAKTHNIICGHFGRNPIEHLENPFVFSIIREPFNQYLSLIKFAASQSGKQFTEEFIDNFLEVDPILFAHFEGMAGCDNPQSCFLYSKISTTEQFVSVGADAEQDWMGKKIKLIAPRFQSWMDKVFFLEHPTSFAQVKEKLDGIAISTLENRNLLIDKINPILSKHYNMRLEHSDKIFNKTPDPLFKIGKRHTQKILDRVQIDLELYAKIRESEKLKLVRI